MKSHYQLTLLDINNIETEKAYTESVRTNFGENVYYSIAHLKYFSADEGCFLKYFKLEKEGELVVLMPIILRVISGDALSETYYDAISPYGYSGPLIKAEVTEEILRLFWEQVDQWYRQNNVVSEFIRFSLNNNHNNYSGTLIETLLNIKGSLPSDFEAKWAGFLPKVRNNYRKAAKSNLSYKIYSKQNLTPQVITVFSEIYTQTMQRNKASGIYFFPESYFINLITSNLNCFSIAVVYSNEIPISTELIIHHKETIFAFLGGTNSEYFSYRPNDFLRVKTIEWAINNGKKHYVLGGGIKNGDGLYKSKKALFPKDNDVLYYTGRKVIDPQKYDELCLLSDPNYQEVKKQVYLEEAFPYYRA